MLRLGDQSAVMLSGCSGSMSRSKQGTQFLNDSKKSIKFYKFKIIVLEMFEYVLLSYL